MVSCGEFFSISGISSSLPLWLEFTSVVEFGDEDVGGLAVLEEP